MSWISLLVTILSLYLVTCEVMVDDRNSKWRENNELLKNVDGYYNKLARRTTDVTNKQKRFMSVLSLALSYNALSDMPTSLQRVQEAVTWTRAQLYKPADALGGETAASLALLRAAIDQPINDIKASCLPNTEEEECLRKLRMYREVNFEQCFEYDRNLELYEKAKNFFNDPQFIDFYKDITEISDNDDEVALSYFINIALVKFPNLIEKGRDILRTRAYTNYPCNSLNLPLY
ncbi:PREDICTED: uncharacterized protein LOC106118514 [Papilio xuthus]|uniref:Uncharacterized protein LOC106118514 n=1 Tax=Papilio xuthus TaxID=66420 RepID=A0AAJ7E9V1_PAPXU|nr:PREDICTED: uncharacterized protein LOC106118514 [Papilio xuthus]